MLIKVIYVDQKYDLVKPRLLEELILAGDILAFRRASGWVNIWKDKIRGKGGFYKGPERRHSQN